VSLSRVDAVDDFAEDSVGNSSDAANRELNDSQGKGLILLEIHSYDIEVSTVAHSDPGTQRKETIANCNRDSQSDSPAHSNTRAQLDIQASTPVELDMQANKPICVRSAEGPCSDTQSSQQTTECGVLLPALQVHIIELLRRVGATSYQNARAVLHQVLQQMDSQSAWCISRWGIAACGWQCEYCYGYNDNEDDMCGICCMEELSQSNPESYDPDEDEGEPGSREGLMTKSCLNTIPVVGL